ncbi:MAG: redox-sensing transcriptional repressor Rex [Candidatus Omnitrophica bacterium]|nr:redox-sensing transcriptional repressor Rex [Candidatus Omnitrophota bacterium]
MTFIIMHKISRKTTERALLYLRTLEGLIKSKRYLVSSSELAKMTGFSDVQIRKDISKFGKVGTPRIGYKTIELRDILERFVLQQDSVQAALFGVGNLGSAILKYPGFHQGRIKIVATFDKDSKKIGKKINGVNIYAIDRAPEIIKKTKIEIGIIAVPKEFSQEVADVVVLSGLKGIINFSPMFISVPKNVIVRDIDFTIEFLSLFCDIQR